MISAIVLTHNEEKKIKNCLKSVLWCDEVIVIDDFSTDTTTLKFCSTSTLKVFRRKLNNDFAGQRNFGLSKAKGEWVLFVDADETVSKSLQKEILLKIKEMQYNGFYIKRRDWFFGKEMKYGEVGNINLLRLAKKNSGKWRRKVHEYWNVKGEIGELKNPILHYHNGTLTDFVSKINFYSTIHSRELKTEGRKSNLVKIVLWPFGKFVYNFIFKLGFLDGVEGLVLAVLMSFHSFLAWSKLWMD